MNMILDVTKLKSMRRWAAEFGQKIRQSPFSAMYAHQLFNENNMSPFAVKVRANFTLVIIDGSKFIIENDFMPKRKTSLTNKKRQANVSR